MVIKFFLAFLFISLQLICTSCQKKERQNQGEPLDYIFYLDPRANVTESRNLFSLYTNAFDKQGISLNSMKLPQNIKPTGLFNQLVISPKISLSKLYQLREKISEISSNDVPFAVFVDNRHLENLSVMLPPFLPTSLYVANNHVTLEGNVHVMKDFIVGLNLSEIELYVGMRSDYQKNILPTKISFKNHISVSSCLLLQSDIHMEDGALSFNEKTPKKGLNIKRNLELYNASISAKELWTDSKKHILFYGNSSIEFQKKSLLNNIVHLQSQDQCFASDISDLPNNSIAKIKNVEFKPQAIFYQLSPLENKGHFEIDGDVDLNHTNLQITVTGKKIPENLLGIKMPIILSTRNIRGVPRLRIEFLYNHIKNDYAIEFIKEKNNAYIVILKK
jgi:hypothetical protein